MSRRRSRCRASLVAGGVVPRALLLSVAALSSAGVVLTGIRRAAYDDVVNVAPPPAPTPRLRVVADDDRGGESAPTTPVRYSLSDRDERPADGDADENDDDARSPSDGRFRSEDERPGEYDDDGAASPGRFRRDDARSAAAAAAADDDDDDEGDDETCEAAPPGTKTEGDDASSARRRARFPRVISLEGDYGGARDDDPSNSGGGPSDDDDDGGTRRIYVGARARHEQKRLADSDDFSYRDPLREGDCVPMRPWQEASFPGCNLLHELDFLGKARTSEFEYYAHGGYNQIFWIDERDKPNDPEVVVKVLKWGTTYSDRNFDRVRRDGLILERLTRSPHVLDIYGFCGFAVLTPYADGGTFSHEMRSWSRGKRKLSPTTRLGYAAEVAAGLADVHDIDGEGLSSVSHGDLKGGQYLLSDGSIRLGDFNRGRFLRRNATAPDTACPYTIGKNDAAFRSPEEYKYLPQTSAIDVWALGSILYQILTGNEVWHDTDTKKAQKNIMEGTLPTIDEKILESRDPVDLALREAIDMCWIYDPKQRAKAADVARFLRKKHSELPKE